MKCGRSGRKRVHLTSIGPLRCRSSPNRFMDGSHKVGFFCWQHSPGAYQSLICFPDSRPQPVNHAVKDVAAGTEKYALTVRMKGKVCRQVCYASVLERGTLELHFHKLRSYVEYFAYQQVMWSIWKRAQRQGLESRVSHEKNWPIGLICYQRSRLVTAWGILLFLAVTSLNSAHRYTFFVLKRRWLARSYFNRAENKSNRIFSRWSFKLKILAIQLPCSWMSLFLILMKNIWLQNWNKSQEDDVSL